MATPSKRSKTAEPRPYKIRGIRIPSEKESETSWNDSAFVNASAYKAVSRVPVLHWRGPSGPQHRSQGGSRGDIWGLIGTTWVANAACLCQHWLQGLNQQLSVSGD